MESKTNPSPEIKSFEIKRITPSNTERAFDSVASEEPLDIRIVYSFKETRRVQSLAVTMRTPGFDRELTAGFLLSEGIIKTAEDLVEIRGLGAAPHNEILAELAVHVDVESWRIRRDTVMHSGCGVCGKTSREAIVIPDYADAPAEAPLSQNLFHRLPSLLATHQQAFHKTGALHAAALITHDGEIMALFEDIGRHNALDKLIGHCLLRNCLPLQSRIVFLSSRSSFELVQKTAMAGGVILATVGGPSSLAIETARALGITLIGFLRDGRFNVYAGEWRIN